MRNTNRALALILEHRGTNTVMYFMTTVSPRYKGFPHGYRPNKCTVQPAGRDSGIGDTYLPPAGSLSAFVESSQLVT